MPSKSKIKGQTSAHKTTNKRVVKKTSSNATAKKAVKKASPQKAVAKKPAAKKTVKSPANKAAVKSSPKKGIAKASATTQRSTKTESSSKSRGIAGKTFLFTGTLTGMQRKEAEALVKENGGSILSGVSDKLNYLVVGEDAGSKLAKAKTLRTVKIMTEKEFLEMVPKSDSKPAGKEHLKFIVFDFRCIDTVDIDQDKLYTPVEKDNMSDGLEEDFHFIWSNLIRKLPVKQIKYSIVQIKHESCYQEIDYDYNIRILVESALNAEELYDKYEEVLRKFSCDPDEYFLGSSLDYDFCDYNPEFSNEILSELKHLSSIGYKGGRGAEWLYGDIYEIQG